MVEFVVNGSKQNCLFIQCRDSQNLTTRCVLKFFLIINGIFAMQLVYPNIQSMFLHFQQYFIWCKAITAMESYDEYEVDIRCIA